MRISYFHLTSIFINNKHFAMNKQLNFNVFDFPKILLIITYNPKLLQTDLIRKIIIISNSLDSKKDFMEIEGQSEEYQDRNQQYEANRLPQQSRLSNQSLISLEENIKFLKHPQKISLQSNMSERVREQQNHRGLFEQLIIIEPQQACLKRRLYDSNPMRYENERMSEEPCNRDKISQEPGFIDINDKDLFLDNQQKITCRCSKSKCLLMYCQCFSKDLVCNESCGCYQCRNNDQFKDKRDKARKSVLDKNPAAFTSQLQMIGNENVELGYKKGCNCKKTRCFKKYCECYHANVKCTYLCNCQGCLNGGQNAEKHQMKYQH